MPANRPERLGGWGFEDVVPEAEQPGEVTRGQDYQDATELRSHPAVQQYMILCLVSLLSLTVILVQRGLDWWSLFPLLIGVLTFLANWSLGPPILLLFVAILVVAATPWWRWQRPSPLLDLGLCASLVIYMLAQYRLLGLTARIFPNDPHRPPGVGTRTPPEVTRPEELTRRHPRHWPVQRRSPDLSGVGECILMMLSAGLWMTAAFVIFVYISDIKPRQGFNPQLWQLLLLTWVGTLMVGFAAAFMTYQRWRTASPQESQLYLQDQLWRQTRKDQNRIQRWLRWARLRGQRRKEKS